MQDSLGQLRDAAAAYGDRFGDTHLLPLAVALLLHLLSLLVRAGVWRSILAAAFPDRRVGWRSAVWSYLAGVGANAVAPFRGGDVVRIFTIRRELGGASVTTIVSTLVAETAFGVVVIGLMVGATVGLGWLPPIVHLPDAKAFEFSFYARHVALVGIALLFKLSGAPFHWWTPDVYQGAPTSITAFMAAGTKIAAFGALMRVFFVAFGGLSWDWRPVMWVIAIVTMAVGAIVGVTQTDVKRLLAYSSIAHAGFILTAVAALAPGSARDSESGVMFYLVAYGFMTIGSFAIVMLVRDGDGEANHLSRWVGLGRRSPLVAGIFAFFLLALAGLPGTSGLWAKVAVFKAAGEGGAWPLVVVGVAASAVTAYYYVRIIVLMFFQEPLPDGPTVVLPQFFTSTAIGLGLAVTVVLGVVPQPLLNLAGKAGLFLK